ncbi:AAA family ATPase [Vibrio sp. 99-8-1]|uniref:AAA family ATPase n=1 Tax=Vibrio sp. 99-8-1 TaxID=2607602 RepID=UPI00149368B8|nr:AAA family ATPase [Vibrio sp. 99-8-1]NOI65991.1 AAA family ATPase [Vibrio sp. 99-8-1]
MSLKFKVQNLGKIEDAEININPLTVITGPNGTGKSFFTKTIYSIFRIIEDTPLISEILSLFEQAKYAFNHEQCSIDECSEAEKEAITSIFKLMEEFSETLIPPYIESQVNLNIISKFKKKLYSNFIVINTENENPDYIDHKKYRVFENNCLASLNSSIGLAITFMSDASFSHKYLIENKLLDEIKDNFQIESSKKIISHNSDSMHLELDSYFDLVIKSNADKERATIKINQKELEFFKNKPRSVFFESPAYWRVRDALVDAKMKSESGYLSGVPKYFFDLDSALRKKSTKSSDLLMVHDQIRSNIGGEFNISNGNIVFFDESSQSEISKNLISFGMTNLGMVNALIKNNVIQKGSYVFIDEPETNLHPDWQVLMIKVLVQLSQAGVNVIINTHSTEILKYIEVRFSQIAKEQGADSVKELLSVNYLDIDGTNFEFDSACPIEQVKEALTELSSPYMNMYMGNV